MNREKIEDKCVWKAVLDRDIRTDVSIDYTHAPNKRICMECSGYDSNCKDYYAQGVDTRKVK